MKGLSEAECLLFTNQFAAAKQKINAMYLKADGSYLDPPADETCDMRPTYALLNAMSVLIQGTVAFAPDHLDASITQCWDALALIDTCKDPESLRHQVTRCMAYFFGGVCQCIQHKFVKGSLNLFQAFRLYPKLRDEVVNSETVEDHIRSGAELTLGALYLAVSMFPPEIIRIAQFVGLGSREDGMRILEKCWQGESDFSPMAATIYITYFVDLKPFLALPYQPSNVDECVHLFLKKFPTSNVFTNGHANLLCVQGKADEAMTLITSIINQPQETPTAVLGALLAQAKFSFCDAQFYKGYVALEESIKILKELGREILVPTVSISAILSLVTGRIMADTFKESYDLTEMECQNLINRQLDIIRQCETLNHGWRPADLWSFRKQKEYHAEPVSIWTSGVADFMDLMQVKYHCLARITGNPRLRLRKLLISILTNTRDLPGEPQLKLEDRIRLEYYVSETYRTERRFIDWSNHWNQAAQSLVELQEQESGFFSNFVTSPSALRCQGNSTHQLLLLSKLLAKTERNDLSGLAHDLDELSRAPSGDFQLGIRFKIAEISRYALETAKTSNKPSL